MLGVCRQLTLHSLINDYVFIIFGLIKPSRPAGYTGRGCVMAVSSQRNTSPGRIEAQRMTLTSANNSTVHDQTKHKIPTRNVGNVSQPYIIITGGGREHERSRKEY